jgi:UDP-glucose 4-epimerase
MGAQSYFITGGAGFIGSHLSELLLRQGHRVVALDDLSTGRRSNIAAIENNTNYRIIEGTVENEKLVGELVREADAVFHLASAVGVQLIVDEPVRTIRTTIHGTEVVLESAYRAGGKPVLITSSSEVYGKGSRVPFSEEDDVVMGATRHSRWCYAYSKGVDEFLGFAYHKQFKLPVTIVRLFNTVGPRQVGMYGMVLPRFVEAALGGRAIQVYGDGKQTRCFCHVQDVVSALAKLMGAQSAVGDVYNLGSDQETSINALAQRVIELTGSSSTIEHVPYEIAYGQAFDDMPRRVPRLDKIRRAIGFAPTFDLDAIIVAVADYLRAQPRTRA